jgi:pantoate--beta-alanine ligase
MQILHNLKSWTPIRRSFSPTLSVGFIPTMGNLHPGHESLCVRSKQENDISVASLFVNPTQFNQPDDYTNYPRTLEADFERLEKCGLDYCIVPTEEEIYQDKYRYMVEERDLCQLMEGKHRPGHFNGVLTVVLKLLNLVKPHNAYFGEKDYQQYLLIKGMVNAFFLDTTIKACPTIRESSGLAYSSRNNRLTTEQRIIAEKFAHIFHQNKPCATITTELQQEGIDVEYLADYQGRRFTAVVIGTIRLIDNFALKSPV